MIPSAQKKQGGLRRTRFTLFAKILGLALTVVGLSIVAKIFDRLQTVAFNERDDARLMNVALLNAHRFERLFLVTRKLEDVEQFSRSTHAVDSILALSGLTVTEQRTKQECDQYNTMFQTLVVTMKERGLNEDMGVEGAFRNSVHGIESITDSLKKVELQVSMLQLRRSEKNFLLRHAEKNSGKYAGYIKDNIKELINHAQESKLPEPIKNQLTTLARDFEEKFLHLVDLYKKIDAVDAQLQGQFDKVNVEIESIVAEKERATLSYQTLSFIATLLAFGIGIGLAIVTARSIAKPIVRLEEAARQVAAGDFTVTIAATSNDEVGSLAESFTTMVQNIREATNALQTEKASVEQKVQVAVAASEHEKEYLATSVETMLEGIGRFSNGDLTVRLDADHTDEIGKLYRGFNQALTGIQDMVQRVIEAVQETASSGAVIAEKTAHLSAGAQEQTRRTNAAVQAIDAISAIIDRNVKKVDEATLQSQFATDHARSGVEHVEQSTRGIGSIVEATVAVEERIAALRQQIDNVSEVANTIREIADQTNLLALNASIEAARAGEQGRGFAVVADEVRKLAERTAEATKDIGSTIVHVQREAHEADAAMQAARSIVGRGMTMMKGVTYMFEEIMNIVQQVAVAIQQVQQSSSEEITLSKNIRSDISTIVDVTLESGQNIKQLTDIAEDLQSVMANLQELVGRFTIQAYNGSLSHSSRSSRSLQSPSERRLHG